MRRLFAERHHAFLAALAANAHVLLLEVDVAEVEADRLRAAEPGRVDELEQGAVAQAERSVAVERVDDRLDLRRASAPPAAARAPWPRTPPGRASGRA